MRRNMSNKEEDERKVRGNMRIEKENKWKEIL